MTEWEPGPEPAWEMFARTVMTTEHAIDWNAAAAGRDLCACGEPLRSCQVRRLAKACGIPDFDLLTRLGYRERDELDRDIASFFGEPDPFGPAEWGDL